MHSLASLRAQAARAGLCRGHALAVSWPCGRPCSRRAAPCRRRVAPCRRRAAPSRGLAVLFCDTASGHTSLPHCHDTILYCDTIPPEAGPCSSVTIHSVYCDTNHPSHQASPVTIQSNCIVNFSQAKQPLACHNTTECIVTRSSNLSLSCCNTPEPSNLRLQYNFPAQLHFLKAMSRYNFSIVS